MKKLGIPTGPAPNSPKRVQVEPCDRRQLECWFESGAFDRILEASEAAMSPEALYWQARAFAEKAKQAHGRLLALPPSAARVSIGRHYRRPRWESARCRGCLAEGCGIGA